MKQNSGEMNRKARSMAERNAVHITNQLKFWNQRPDLSQVPRCTNVHVKITNKRIQFMSQCSHFANLRAVDTAMLHRPKHLSGLQSQYFSLEKNASYITITNNMITFDISWFDQVVVKLAPTPTISEQSDHLNSTINRICTFHIHAYPSGKMHV